MNTLEFVSKWNKANSAAEVAAHFGTTSSQVRAKAAYLRSKYGFDLKDMRSARSNSLRKLAAESHQEKRL